VIACENHAQAEARANLILHYCGYPGMEVWDRGWRVYRARKVDAAGGPQRSAAGGAGSVPVGLWSNSPSGLGRRTMLVSCREWLPSQLLHPYGRLLYRVPGPAFPQRRGFPFRSADRVPMSAFLSEAVAGCAARHFRVVPKAEVASLLTLGALPPAEGNRNATSDGGGLRPRRIRLKSNCACAQMLLAQNRSDHASRQSEPLTAAQLRVSRPPQGPGACSLSALPRGHLDGLSATSGRDIPLAAGTMRVCRVKFVVAIR
jgi:hypothetical protein